MFFGSNVVGKIIEAESERGLRRLPRWHDDRLPWDSEAVQRCINSLNDPDAAEELLKRLLSIIPQFAKDSFDLIGVDKRSRAGMVEDVVSRAMMHAHKHLHRIAAGKTPGQIWNYFQARCKSLTRETLDDGPVRLHKRGREPLGDHHSYRHARYAEACQTLCGVALRVAPASLMELLADLMAGQRVKQAVGAEVRRRKGQTCYPRSDDAVRAGVWRELGLLGALTLAASPDWCILIWADANPSELLDATA